MKIFLSRKGKKRTVNPVSSVFFSVMDPELVLVITCYEGNLGSIFPSSFFQIFIKDFIKFPKTNEVIIFKFYDNKHVIAGSSTFSCILFSLHHLIVFVNLQHKVPQKYWFSWVFVFANFGTSKVVKSPVIHVFVRNCTFTSSL